MNAQRNSLERLMYKGDALIVGLVLLVIVIFAGVVYALIDNDVIDISSLTGDDNATEEVEEDPYANRTLDTYTNENLPGLKWEFYNNWTLKAEGTESSIVPGTEDLSVLFTDGGVELSFNFFPVTEINFPSKCYDQGGINYVRLNDEWVRITTQTGYVYSQMLYDVDNDPEMFNDLVTSWTAAGNEGTFVACGEATDTASAMEVEASFDGVTARTILNIKMSVDATGNNTLLTDADKIVMSLFE